MRKWLFVALTVAFGAVAGLIALGWTPDRPFESLKARWAPTPSKFVTIDNVAVHLRDEGAADDEHPLVLIHGTSANLFTWQDWVTALKGQHRVITFDLPGAGLSGPFPDDDYHIEHFTAFVEDLLDQLRIKRAILVGNSLGGRIAWEVAVARPDLIQRLVLIDARGYPGEDGPPPMILRVAKIPILGHWFIEHITPRSLIEKSLKSVVGDPRRITPEKVERYYELFLHAGNRRALLLELEQSSFTDSDRIRKIAVPTLILWGGKDRHLPVSDAERFHEDIPDSRVVIFSGLGHLPQEEDPAQTAEVLKNFLAQ